MSCYVKCFMAHNEVHNLLPEWRRVEIDATLSRCIDVDTT